MPHEMLSFSHNIFLISFYLVCDSGHLCPFSSILENPKSSPPLLLSFSNHSSQLLKTGVWGSGRGRWEGLYRVEKKGDQMQTSTRNLENKGTSSSSASRRGNNTRDTLFSSRRGQWKMLTYRYIGARGLHCLSHRAEVSLFTAGIERHLKSLSNDWHITQHMSADN